MSVLIITNADQLKELRASSEKPEHHILRPEVAATAYDQALYKRLIHYVDVKNGQGSMLVIFSITKGQKNGIDTLFRHASFREVGKDEPNPNLVFMSCLDLGFTGSVHDWHIERHPQSPDIIALFQEWK